MVGARDTRHNKKNRQLMEDLRFSMRSFVRRVTTNCTLTKCDVSERDREDDSSSSSKKEVRQKQLLCSLALEMIRID
jgi:hypothetical protein